MEEMARPLIPFGEWDHVSRHVPPLVVAINETSHRQQHVACVAYQMLLHLPVAERPGVIGYLTRVARGFELNKGA
jgi:hypothetical protein